MTATCEHPGCNEKIDRGMSFACGGEPFSEYGCDRYFCPAHLFYTQFNKEGEVCSREDDCQCVTVAVCKKCHEGKGDLFDYKPEHPEWVYHLLNHHSWERWRKENPDAVAELQKLPSTMPEGWSNDPDAD